jgi:glycylpeptide N-tetradecanoyltransferase
MENHKFWKTQPIINTKTTKVEEDGIIQIIDVEGTPKEPYKLPDGYEWHTLDLNDETDLNNITKFLLENYLEDSEVNLQFNYSKESIKWFAQRPNHFPELFICIRVTATKKIAATIFGIPSNLNINQKNVKLIEINLLCVNKKLRSKRLAVVMIKEVSRRVIFRGVWHAVYTAVAELPNTLSNVTYYHRFINIRKLMDIDFINRKNNTLSIMERLHKIKEPEVKMRLLQKEDIPQCVEKLNKKLNNFKLTHVFDNESFEHYFMPRENVIYTYVVEKDGKVITDLISYYIVDNKVVNNPKHTSYRACYLYYYFNESTSLETLMNSCLYYAQKSDVDVFNILNMFELDTIVKDCKFVRGSGSLNYYLYNYKCNTMKSNEIGLPVF